MIKILLKNSSEFVELSKAEFEQKMGIEWLDHLEFCSDKVIQKVHSRSEKAMKKKELSIREKWIGTHFHKEISYSFLPLASIRWIDEKIGYGVFAEEDIPAGAYIGEYTGLVRKRRRLIDRKNDYCFEYTIGDWIYNPFIIDAKGQGNFTRYINHRDDPNLDPLSVFADGVMHIVFVAKKAIPAGTELSYHYGDTFWKKRTNKI